MIDEILEFNKKFVEDKMYEPFITSKFPDKKIAIVTCMDTRLTHLLPAALGLKNGDAKIIKNAGGTIVHPYGSVMKSLLIAIYELQVEEIYIIGHTDCGVKSLDYKEMLEKIKERGIPQSKIEEAQNAGIDLKQWLDGFEEIEDAVTSSINIVREHPFVPKDIPVYGFILDSVTGELNTVK